MGFTHRAHQERGPISPARWKKICDDVNLLIDQSPHPIRLYFIDRKEIHFNGTPGYEDFYLRRVPEETFSFTKTNWQPYDLVVCAAYAVAAEHAGGKIEISSDGGEAHWAGPLQWASQTLGRKVPMPRWRVGTPSTP